jgi:Protein of unknown function (DUF1266)
MTRWLCGFLLFFSLAFSQSTEEVTQHYIEAFNTKDTAAILSLYDDPKTQQHVQFLLPYAFERLRIEPDSVRVVDQGNRTALVYLNYLPRSGHWIPGTLLLLNIGDGYKLSYSDLNAVLKQTSPFLSVWLDIRQRPELLIALGAIGLVAAFSVFALLSVFKSAGKPQLFIYENPKTFKPSSETLGLALGSIYRSSWGLPLDKTKPHQGLLEMLSRDWDIHNRDQLLFNMMSLYHHGHRANFKGLSASYPEANGDHLAWDMTQYIILGITGVSVGYLLPHEASNLILHALLRLQKHYSSWPDYAKAFQRERFLWQRLTLKPLDWDLEQHNTSQDRLIQKLLKRKDSPWRKIPWTTPVDTPKDNDFFAAVSQHYFSLQEPLARDESILN